MSKELSSEDFAALYSACHLDLLRYVLTLLPDRPQAEDVVQEVARLLWQKRHEYDSAKPFLPWARGFARFEVLMAIRRQNVRGKYFSPQLVAQLAEERGALRSERGATVIVPRFLRCLSLFLRSHCKPGHNSKNRG